MTSIRKKKCKILENEFYCNSAIDARRGLYYELDWERHCEEAKAEGNVDGKAWHVISADSTELSRSRRSEQQQSSSDEGSGDDYERPDEEDDTDDDASIIASVISDVVGPPSNDEGEGSEGQVHHTPRKRKLDENTRTPRKAKRTKRAVAKATPHTKAALKARARRARNGLPLPPADHAMNYLNLEGHALPEDPWLRAMQVLHVGSRPDILPCREGEFSRVLSSVEGLLEEGSGGCVCELFLRRLSTATECFVDISGVPGTGKTATVHRVVRELKRMAERNVRGFLDSSLLHG